MKRRKAESCCGGRRHGWDGDVVETLALVGAQAEACATWGWAPRESCGCMKKYSAGCIFLLHAGVNLVFCECELTLPIARVRIA